MKKIKELIFFVILLSFFVNSLGNSKIIKFDENFELDVPSNYSFLKFTDQIEGIDMQEMEKYGMQAYFLGDKKLIDWPKTSIRSKKDLRSSEKSFPQIINMDQPDLRSDLVRRSAEIDVNLRARRGLYLAMLVE